MPKVSSPAPEYCAHYDIHGTWVAQGIHWRVCNLPKPRLINAIRMLERTIAEAYPVQAGRTQLSLYELSCTEDNLRMLSSELERRNDAAHRY